MIKQAFIALILFTASISTANAQVVQYVLCQSMISNTRAIFEHDCPPDWIFIRYI